MTIGPVVIVGGGQAGFQLAASLREEGVAASVTILTAEAEPPYQRPPLSKAFLTGLVETEDLLLGGPRFFAGERIAVKTACPVARIDRDDRRVVTEAGEVLSYEHLVLATGARNRPLPVPHAGLANVVQLRTLADAADLKMRLQGTRRVVVVGAGFIGLEIATLAAGLGHAVTVLEASSRVLSRSVSEPVSSFLQSHVERCGVTLRLDAVVDAFEARDGLATAVVTRDGQAFPADFVLIGIGVIPNVELAIEAGLTTENGIAVDEQLLTADPAISAIGDCAAFPSPFQGGRRVRLESVQNAVDGARCVAARLAGRPARYADVPWFWSELGSVRLQIAGLGAPGEHSVLRGDPASGAFSAFSFEDDRLVRVESINRPADHFAARKLLRAGRGLRPREAADPGVSLRAQAEAAVQPG